MRYIPPSQLYRSLYERLIQLLLNEVDSRLTNMTYLMMGIFLAKKVQTGVIATKVPLLVKRVSIIRCLERFLDNGQVRVRGWYERVAVGLLQAAASSGQIVLIIDGTKVSFHHQLLMVAVAYHGRALPIAWTWVPHARGHSTQAQQLALLRYVNGLIPAGVSVSLVGDTEFGHTLVLEELDHWRWNYALRQSGHNLVMTRQSSAFQPLESLLTQVGQWLWMPSVVLTQANGLCRKKRNGWIESWEQLKKTKTDVTIETPPPFKGRHYQAEIIVLCVRWYLRYSLSYRDLEEMLVERGVRVDHSTIARWVLAYAPELEKRVKPQLKPTNDSWKVDETYSKVKGEWLYQYRAVDSDGQTIEFFFSAKRDAAAAQAFFEKALGAPHSVTPRVINVDKNAAYPKAMETLKINQQLPADCELRQVKYLNNLIEQDHRFIKRRTRPGLGFFSFDTAQRALAGYETMNMIRKGQMKGAEKGDILAQVELINRLFGIAA